MLLLVPLALVACADPYVPPPRTRASEVERESEERHRREREARLVAELEKEKARNAKLEEEERERNQKAAEENARAVAEAEAREKARQAQAQAAENEKIKAVQARMDWLFRGNRWNRQEDEPVFTVWVNYALIPERQRTIEGLLDAGKEALAKAPDSAAVAWNRVFFRRAFADLAFPGSRTSNGPSEVLMLNDDWTVCQEMTAKLLANKKSHEAIKNAGFRKLYCSKVKQSTVTGNSFTDDEKTWEIK